MGLRGGGGKGGRIAGSRSSVLPVVLAVREVGGHETVLELRVFPVVEPVHTRETLSGKSAAMNLIPPCNKPDRGGLHTADPPLLLGGSPAHFRSSGEHITISTGGPGDCPHLAPLVSLDPLDSVVQQQVAVVIEDGALRAKLTVCLSWDRMKASADSLHG